MASSILLVYAIASFSVIIIPGPTMLLALTNGSCGKTNIVAAGIVGAVIADLILMITVFLGLGAILIAFETLFAILKWLGVAYLIFLAVQLWQANPSLKQVNIAYDKQASKAFTRALLVAVSNPKALLFFTAFFPQFINITAPQIPQYLILASITTVINITVMGCYALVGFYMGRTFTSKGLRYMNRSCAMIMLSLAVFLAIYRKS